MKINSFSVAGFGPIRTYEINTQNPLVAISAPNGSGKTFLIESPFAALYGRFPHAQCNAIQGLTDYSNGDGELSVCIDEYKVTRKYKNRQKSEFSLLKNNEQHAADKAKDFQDGINEVFLPKEIALMTWMSAHDGVGDICYMSEAERRDVFAFLLDFEKLNQYSSEFKVKSDAFKAKSEALISEIRQFPNDFEEKTICLIEQHNKDLALIRESIIKKDTQVQMALEYQKSKKSLELLEQYNELKAKILPIDEERITFLKKESSRLSELMNMISTREHLISENKELKKRVCPDSRNVERDIISHEKSIETLRDKLQEINFATHQKEFKIKDIEEKLKMDLPFGEKCHYCPLVNLNDAASLDSLKEELVGLISEKQGIKSKIESEESTRKNLTEIQKSYENNKQLRIIIDKNEEKIRDLDEKIGVNTMDLIHKKIHEHSEEYSMLESTRRYNEKISSDIKLIKSNPDFSENPKVIPSVQVDIQGTLNDIKDLRGKEMSLTLSLKDLQKSLDEFQKNHELKEKADILEKRSESCKTLSAIFGPKGIQAVLIDKYAANIERKANDIISDLTEKPLRVALRTREPLKNGGYRERMDLVYSGKSGKFRPFAFASGGEKTIIRLSLRLAIIDFIYETKGIRFKTLLLDEALDNLDIQNKENAVSLFRKILKNKFVEQIIAVLHENENILSNFDEIIEFKP